MTRSHVRWNFMYMLVYLVFFQYEHASRVDVYCHMHMHDNCVALLLQRISDMAVFRALTCM